MSRPEAIKNELGEILKAGGVVVDQGKVLLVSDVEGKVWSFPKGHVAQGETVEQAAIREILEETGYEVELISRLPDVTYMREDPIRVAMFKARLVKETRSREKETQCRWFPIEEAEKELILHKPRFLIDALYK